MRENLRKGKERNGKRRKDLISAVLYYERQSDLNKIFNGRHFFSRDRKLPTQANSVPFISSLFPVSLYPLLFILHS